LLLKQLSSIMGSTVCHAFFTDEIGATPPFPAPGSVGCPSRWIEHPSTIQVDWTAPQRPNGIVLQYYLVLTNFGGNTVIAATTVNSSDAFITNFANERLGE